MHFKHLQQTTPGDVKTQNPIQIGVIIPLYFIQHITTQVLVVTVFGAHIEILTQHYMQATIIIPGKLDVW